MNELRDFIFLSKYAGMREDLVQAGGGNTSVKIDAHKMFIKASGYQLSEISSTFGYSTVDYTVINNYFRKENFEQLGVNDEKRIITESIVEGLRPSIETFLHSTTNKFTLHTHPVVVNAMVTNRNTELLSIFPNAKFVDYATPGIELAKKYYKVLNEISDLKTDTCGVVFLKNHGLVVTGDSVDKVIAETEHILKKIETYLGVDYAKYHNTTKLFFFITNIEKTEDIVYLSNRVSAKRIMNNFNYAFCPDALVYLGKKILFLDGTKEKMTHKIMEHTEKYGKAKIIVYRDNVYIRAINIKKAKEIESLLEFCDNVLTLNPSTTELTNEEQNIVLGLESEKYRQNLV